MSRRGWAIVALAVGFAVGYVTAASADPETAAPLFHGAEQVGAATAAKITKEHDLADQGKARLLVVAAVGTDNWGCECPPFVYEPYGAGADDAIAYFYPVVKSGPDPGTFPTGAGAGEYRFTGHFAVAKDALDYAGWLDRRKVRHGKIHGDLFGVKRRVFVVDHWCFDNSGPVDGPYADMVAKMKKAGVTFCQ